MAGVQLGEDVDARLGKCWCAHLPEPLLHLAAPRHQGAGREDGPNVRSRVDGRVSDTRDTRKSGRG